MQFLRKLQKLKVGSGGGDDCSTVIKSWLPPLKEAGCWSSWRLKGERGGGGREGGEGGREGGRGGREGEE